jgi:hypothetical protein
MPVWATLGDSVTARCNGKITSRRDPARREDLPSAAGECFMPAHTARERGYDAIRKHRLNMPPRTECYSHSLSRTYRPTFRFVVFHSGIPRSSRELRGQQSTGMNRYASINHVHSKDGARR